MYDKNVQVADSIPKNGFRRFTQRAGISNLKTGDQNKIYEVREIGYKIIEVETLHITEVILNILHKKIINEIKIKEITS